MIYFLLNIQFVSLLINGFKYTKRSMDRIWRLKKQGDQNEVKHLSAALNVNMVIARLLVQRGIKTYNEAKAFFRPRLSDLHDPYIMKDMGKAVERWNKAIENQEKVISVTKLASVAGLSEAHLRRIFRSELKISPKQYLMQVRMNYARSLMQAEDLRV